MTLARFSPIFDDVAWLRRMLPLGVRLVQLRLKDRNAADMARQIAQARDLCWHHGAVLGVNDHWQSEIDTGCDFVHLGQEDLDTADLPAIHARGCVWGSALMTTPNWSAFWR